jgi:rhodanese-related sulfurtransferase
MNVSEIDVTDVPDGARLVDVREDSEWQAGHAPDAIHIPMGELPDRLDDLPDEQPLYIVCKVGGRSAHVAAWLNGVGRQAINVAGGMESWDAAGRPMVSETDKDPFVA